MRKSRRNSRRISRRGNFHKRRSHTGHRWHTVPYANVADMFFASCARLGRGRATLCGDVADAIEVHLIKQAVLPLGKRRPSAV
jgi:hypothetical protein